LNSITNCQDEREAYLLINRDADNKSVCKQAKKDRLKLTAFGLEKIFQTCQPKRAKQPLQPIFILSILEPLSIHQATMMVPIGLANCIVSTSYHLCDNITEKNSTCPLFVNVPNGIIVSSSARD